MFKTIILLVVSLISLSALNAQTTITGTLVGFDGKPMLKANAVIQAGKIADVDKGGKYSITVDSAGIWTLVFAGVNHSSRKVELYVDKPGRIDLDVRLKTYDYVDTFADVKIDTALNPQGTQTAGLMQKQSDNTFTAEFQTNEDSLAYELEGITKDGHTVNGTQSERYAYDGGGDYWSVLTPSHGTVKIIFDPAKLVRSDRPAEVTFMDSQSTEAKFAQIYDEMMEERLDYSRAASAYTQSGKDMYTFKYDVYWSKEVESIAAKLGRESNPILRQELYMNYFWLALFNAKLDASIVEKALREIPPSSVVWSLIPNAVSAAAVEHFPGLPSEEQDNYAQRVLNENPDAMVKAQLLYNLCDVARHRHDTTNAATYYKMLVDKYGGTTFAKWAKAEFSPDAKVAVGKPVLSFSIASLEDSTKIFTNEYFQGKYYMIDFWATWCGPCVAEMEYLHKAYARFKDKNFTMLSVSLDGLPQDVAKFRKGKWPMPWLHAFGGHGWDSKMVKDFEVMAIPKPILVDSTGTIVATEGDLQGDRLETTLEKYLGK
jgi:thiol-disulfide isomerase/thioredoxin